MTELRCYLPVRADPTGRLRHFGARRTALTVAVDAARQQVRDLLECAWPAVPDAAGQRCPPGRGVRRGGPAASILEMCLAMYLSFAVLLPAHWLGLLSGEAVIVLGHIVMLPAMAAVMLCQREQYLDYH